MNVGLPPCRIFRRRRLLRRGRISRKALGSIVGVSAVLLLLLGTWLIARRSAKDQQDNPSGESGQTAAELRIELATPLDRAAESAEPALKETLATVADAARAKADRFDDPAWLAMLKSRFSWGDQRKAAEGVELSVSRNWELRLTKGVTRDQYAKLLDFFGVELAVIMPNNKLIYVRDFSRAKPKNRTGAASEEKRYYLTWREGSLSEADRELLARAGITLGNRVVLTILPPTVEETLARLEKTHAGKDIDRVRKTRFGVHITGDAFVFYVIEQDLE